MADALPDPADSGKPVPEGLSIRANMLWNSAGSMTYLVFQWLMTVLVVKLSDDYEAAGVLALAMAVFNIFQPLAIYRMYTYQVSDIRRENSVGEYVAFRLATAGAALVGCVVYAAITAPQAILAITLYAIVKILSLVIDVLHGCDQLNGRMDYIGQSLMIQGVFTFAAFVGIFGTTSSLELAFVGMAVVTVAIGFLFDLPRTRQFGPIRVRITRVKMLHLLAYCLPIVIAAIAVATAPSVPRQYLAHLEGASALGIYASVAAPIAVIQMGASYIYNPLLSVFSAAFLERRISDLVRAFRKVVLGIMAIGVLAAAFFQLAGPTLLPLIFDESIREYTYLLLPIIVNTVVSAYVWFFSDLLVALREFKASFIGNVVSVLVALPASYFFVREWTMNGVSFTGILASGVGAAIMLGHLMILFRRLGTEQE
ncbi:lipopolysaccharide biosynthesis protein [Actinomyces provencensis]|uniref:lipopolysaccharide biosynthesis protein n=1 Tax=Actinomyces provencensis TaxID=1720198 RepID=UPI00096A62BE|nr:lipopolysaccharide biosynthesis protein [Actinomyces provencensis]